MRDLSIEMVAQIAAYRLTHKVYVQRKYTPKEVVDGCYFEGEMCRRMRTLILVQRSWLPLRHSTKARLLHLQNHPEILHVARKLCFGDWWPVYYRYVYISHRVAQTAPYPYDSDDTVLIDESDSSEDEHGIKFL